MILIKETIAKFGYDPSTFKSKTTRRVVCRCDVCSTILERGFYDLIKNGKTTYECKSCSMARLRELTRTPGAKAKRKATLLAKFGVDNPMRISWATDKAKETCLQKYGVEHLSKSPEFQQRRLEKDIKKYGKSFLQTEEFKQKTAKTVKARYGVDCAMDSPLVKEKLAATVMKNYGVSCVFASNTVKEKILNYWQKNHGVSNGQQVPAIQEKTRETCMERYGVTNPTKSKEIVAKSMATKLKNYGTLSPSVFGKTEQEIRTWLAAELGEVFEADTSILGGFELDAFSPHLKLAIEYCGLYWHNEHTDDKKNRYYHFKKYAQCADLGIRLITIFEDEWIHRQEQVKSFLRTILGKNKRVLQVSDCVVAEIESTRATTFFQNYSIAGAPHHCTKAVGLFYKEELIGALSISGHGSTVTITGIGFKTDFTVNSGMAKLLELVLVNSKISELIIWSDNRWGTPFDFAGLGFKIDKAFSPDFSYANTKKQLRFDKQTQRKSKTKRPNGISEKDWAIQHGLFRIWDCGKLKWKLTVKS